MTSMSEEVILHLYWHWIHKCWVIVSNYGSKGRWWKIVKGLEKSWKMIKGLENISHRKKKKKRKEKKKENQKKNLVSKPEG